MYRIVNSKISLTILCLIIAGALAHAAPTPRATRYLAGLKPPTAELKHKIETSSIRVIAPRTGFRAMALPAKVKNVQFLPAVREQALANCGAYAPSYYYKTFQEAKEHGWVKPNPDIDPQHVMSPGFTYPLTNGGVNEGAWPAHVMQIMCRYGISSWQDLPENVNYNIYPSEKAFRAAMKYRGKEVMLFDTSTDAGILALKEHLSTGDCAVMGVQLYHDTFDQYGAYATVGVNNEVIYANGTDPWGIGHAFTLIGYDDNKSYNDGTGTKKGAFLAVNSWGTGWGVNDSDVGSGGCVWFSYDYIKSKRGFQNDICAMTDRINYQPTDVAIIGLYHSQLAEINASILAGPMDKPIGSLEAFPDGGGLKPYSGRYAIDITDFASGDPYNYWLDIEDADIGGNHTGAITYFQVERGGTTTFTCKTVPILTIDDDTIRIRIGAVEMADEDSTPCVTSSGMAWGDYNKDGYPDVAFIGAQGIKGITRVNQNDGSGQLYDSRNAFPGLYYGRVAWTDYDLDGLPDLSFCGYDGTLSYTKVFKNNGGGRFADTTIALPGVSSGCAMAWGDYDNDGDQDLALSGYSNNGKLAKILRNDKGKFVDSQIALPQLNRVPMAWADVNNDGYLDLLFADTIYRNNGNSTFTAAATIIPGSNGEAAWGDYDNDGDLDLAITVATPTQSTPAPTTKIYRNDGNFALNDTNTTLTNVFASSIAWGDFTNDGLLDLAIAGSMDSIWEKLTTSILRQNPDHSFTDIGADIAPSSDGQIGWADADRDGDLDLFVVGDGMPHWSGNLISNLYTSLIANNPGCGRPNLSPSVPANLVAQQGESASTILLKWSKSTDAKTPSLAMEYNIRVGTTSGGSEVVSPGAGCQLLGNFPHAALATGQPGLRLKGLTPGRYFWSVQAIDNGMAVSDWSPEQIFVLTSAGINRGDVNNDGKVDAADLVLLQRMLAGSSPMDLARADMDGDAKASESDSITLSKSLIGLAYGDYLTIAHGYIGPDGGAISADGVELVIPPKALVATVDVEIGMASGLKPMGSKSPDTLYQFGNLPEDIRQPLTLRLRDTRADKSKPPLFAYGESAMPYTGDEHFSHRVLQGAASSGWATLIIPAADLTPAKAPSALRAMGKITDADSITSTTHKSQFETGLLKDWYTGTSTNFKVYYSDLSLLTSDVIDDLLNDLEQAKVKYASLGFSYERRTNWPLEITIKDLGTDLGGAYNSKWGMNYGYMEFSPNALKDRAEARITAFHEFFHITEGLYDPRSAITKAHLAGPDYWLREAGAVWAEEFAAADSKTYTSFNYSAGKNRYAPFEGMIYAAAGNKSQLANHGYGMAALIKHLATAYDTRTIVAIYEKLYENGGDALKALIAATPANSLPDWHNNLFLELLSTTFYKAGAVDLFHLATPEQRFLIRSDSDVSATFNPIMPGLGAELYLAKPDVQYTGLRDDAMLAFRLKGHGTERLTVMTAKNSAILDSSLGSDNGEGIWRHTIPNLKALQVDAKQVFALVTNNDTAKPGYTGNYSPLDIGVVRPLDGSFPLLNNTASAGNTSGLGFPQFNCSGSFSVMDKVGNFSLKMSINSAGESYQHDKLEIWEDTPITVLMNFNAPLVAATFTFRDYAGTRYEYTAAKKTMRLIKRMPPDGAVAGQEDNPAGAFTLTLNKGEDWAYFVAEVHYSMHTDIYNRGGTLIGKTDNPDLWCVPMVFYLTGK